MTHHVPVSAPVSFAPGIADCRSAQPGGYPQGPCSDRAKGHTGPHRQQSSSKTVTRSVNRWQRCDDRPETQSVAAILRTVPPHHTYHRLSGVAVTLDRIGRITRVTA